MNEAKEFFIPIDGESLRIGRLVISEHHDGFSIEVAIVYKESKKIWQYVDTLFKVSDFQDALYLGRNSLWSFLKSKTIN